jgi:acyl-CoA synthetase (AMP-forming)/AMP-acid ligase II
MTARNSLLAVGGVALGGLTYFLKSNSEDVLQDFKDLFLLGKVGIEVNKLSQGNFTFVQFFDETAAKYPHRIATIYIDESGVTTSFTWHEMDVLSNKVANWGLGQGLQVGDCAALVMDNRPEFIIFWLGLAKIGVQTALINTNLVGNPLKHCLSISKPKLFLIGHEHVEKCAHIRKDLGGGIWYTSTSLKTVVTHHSERLAARLPEGFEEIDYLIHTRNASRPTTPQTPSTTPLVYIYTSGTTGFKIMSFIFTFFFIFFN